ncbi:hypothetical protein ISS30_11130 [bacterium]|nr:hypothetical protein [FCB group bacterium]MBL7192231.1 hypothetical protein [bacterium]
MFYTYKNTIILLTIILLITLAGAYYSAIRLKNSITAAEEELKELDKSIVQIPQLEDDILQIYIVIDQLDTKLESFDKTIDPELTAAKAYSFIDSVQDKFGFLKCTVIFLADSLTEDYNYISFTVKGESVCERFYSFIWALERGPMLFKIDRLDLRSVEEMDRLTGRTEAVLVFELEIRAIYAQLENLPPIENKLISLSPPSSSYNPFYPSITQNIAPNVHNLPEVESAELKAILPDKIILTDAKNNVHALQTGDRVYLGYLRRIDYKGKYAEFLLNKGGIVEYFKLYLTISGEEN